MTPLGVSVRETWVPGMVPRLAIPGWQDQWGVVAGITARGGDGAEGAPFDLGLWGGGPVGQVMARWRAFRQADPRFHAHRMAHQCHGTQVLRHREDVPGWTVGEGADGHVTSLTGVLLMVTVADCVPVYLLDPIARVAGLIHAGWRGTSRGILGGGVRAMVESGASVENIVIHFGVAICGDCYEVGSEVANACGVEWPPDRKGHLDLRGILADQASEMGIVRQSTSQFCSAHDSRYFFSHRGSGGADGRMVAYLGFPVRGTV